ncbi:MAG: inorganic phosphate transporter, partial [Patescibacteria group bacterium]
MIARTIPLVLGILFAVITVGGYAYLLQGINASIMGVGASKRVSAVRWGVATNIVIAWVLTLPTSAALAWVSYEILTL